MPESNETKPVVLFAAGSQRRAFAEILPRFEAISGLRVAARFGEAGLLREQIEAGASFDLFASANTAHPQRLFAAGLAERPVLFARNDIVIIARRGVVTLDDDPIDRMLDPDVAVGISAPIAGPSGDYALMVFDRIDEIRPGDGEAIRRKAKVVIGGHLGCEIPAGRQWAEWLISTGRADLVLAYRSAAVEIANDPGLVVVALPATVAVTADYALAVAVGADGRARDLAAHLVGPQAEDVMLAWGFRRRAPTGPE